MKKLLSILMALCLCAALLVPAMADVDALTQYAEGPYAYWLAAGFPVDADEAMIENVITLFCEENLAEMAAEEPAA